ncbi:hypothetical protein [Sphingobium sp. Ant17]|uniref:hypothetical protein n=1 Tax=Sphingobium sp. Ant17 TaxID=1461752 RepID=UPI00045065E9|nr:hypothetical protein [Sphingobium sp. Ant17]EXS68803.1 hypothetical protein BF95_12480 [Sphingobium sp. Ant17]MDE0946022.1 hypothetical protein [Sphingobium sp.]|tara:strand:+ start:4575 stop:5123 length:549 start_codon:yes stop_codon:yes gene_type:complete
MKHLSMSLLGVFLCLMTGSASAAPKRQQPRPEIFTDLLQCRSVAQDAERLACFDRQVGAIDAAAQRDEVVVLDKSELNKTRKTLFGFSFPKLPFLGGGEADDSSEAKVEGVDQIEAVIASVRSLGYGKWQIGLEDGAVWATTEAMTARDPKVGQTIELKRAAMGSFMGKVAGGRAVRMKRVS